MKLFIYEFICGGGTFHFDGAEVPSGTLLREGLAMLQALTTDFSRHASLDVVCLWDERLPTPILRGIQRRIVRSPVDERRLFRLLAADCDRTMVIAPEFNGYLAERARWVEEVAGTLISPDSRFVEITSDKSLTCQLLSESGVPVPRTIAYRSDLATDPTLDLPVVVKPIDGAGSTDVRLIGDWRGVDRIAANGAGRIFLQPFCPGRTASVAVLSGPVGRVILPPFWQHTEPPGFEYRGGSRIMASSLVQRAHELAHVVCESLPATQGYWGIDFVLGAATSGADDRVLEVNPRLTTSYVGLRGLACGNLAVDAMEIANGGRPHLSFRPDPIEFLASGEIIEPDLRQEGSSVP